MRRSGFDTHAGVPDVARNTLVPPVLAALFTLGCTNIHAARRQRDAVTLAHLLLLGFLAAVYVGQHTRLDARHLNWQHEVSELRQPLPAHPMM